MDLSHVFSQKCHVFSAGHPIRDQSRRHRENSRCPRSRMPNRHQLLNKSREITSMKTTTTKLQSKPSDADSERQPLVSRVEGTGSHIYVVGIPLVAAIGGFLFGFDSGVVNGTVHALSVAFGTHAAATGFAVASVLLGCAAGAFGAGTLANRIGRRPAMLINAVIFLLSAFASGGAGSSGVFIASRIVGEIGIGAVSVLASMYIAE